MHQFLRIFYFETEIFISKNVKILKKKKIAIYIDIIIL